jgi:hypothetical protein
MTGRHRGLWGQSSDYLKSGFPKDFTYSSNPEGSVCVCQEQMRNSPSFEQSIDNRRHVIELHASRGAETCTFVTFIYEKDSERLLRHFTGSDETEVIRQALMWCDKN